VIFSKPCLGICLILCLMFLSWFYGRSLNSFYVFSSDKYIVTHRRFCLAHSIFWFRFSIQIPFVKNTLSCPFFCFDFLLNLEGQVPQAKNNISQQRYAGSSQKAFYTFFCRWVPQHSNFYFFYSFILPKPKTLFLSKPHKKIIKNLSLNQIKPASNAK